MHKDLPLFRQKLKGSALMLILIILGLATALLVSALKSNPQIERDKITADALAKAKDALIGYAATYRDSHSSSGPVFGYLPCPAIDGNGVAGNCGSKDVTLIGLLPWKTLGMPPLRDSSGECLWYAVSGKFKNSPQTTLLNWDTAGQLSVNDAGGSTLASGGAAVIFSPRGVIGSQNRTPEGATECGGNTTVAAYLDGSDTIYAGTAPAPGADSTLTVATVASIANGTNNDRGLWITPDEIFRRIKQRRDFKAATPNGDVNNLISSVAACLNALTTLPAPITINFTNMTESAGTTVGSLVAGRIPQSYVDTYCSSTSTGIPAWRTAWNGWWNNSTTYTGRNFYKNWQDNLLYAKCSSGKCLTVNGASCAAVLIFSGERDATTPPAQNRATAANKNIWSNYLEGNPLGLFNSGTPTSFTGVSTNFTIANVNTAATADIVACINSTSSTTPPDVSFATNINSFITSESANPHTVAVDTTTDPTNPTVSLTAENNKAGCFWFPTVSTLSGKTLRAYFEFQFNYTENATANSNGNGMTFAMMPGGTTNLDTRCGDNDKLGYESGNMPGTLMGVQVDTNYDSNENDPGNAMNHIAVLPTASIQHNSSGAVTSACNGNGAVGCYKSFSSGTPNWFEDSSKHNLRIEIQTQCNSSCSSCASGGRNAYVKIWADCSGTGCTDYGSNYAGTTPHVAYCTSLPAGLNSVIYGFTSSNTSGGHENVTVSNFGINFR
jgi:hypothetical protein